MLELATCGDPLAERTTTQKRRWTQRHMIVRIGRFGILIPIVLMAVGLAGCVHLAVDGILHAGAANLDDPAATLPMVPLGPSSAAAVGLEKQRTQLSSSRKCSWIARYQDVNHFGNRRAPEFYVQCMAQRGYRCADRSQHKACEAAWTHPTATREQWREDTAECLRSVFFVVLASTRHARAVECMKSKGYRPDVGEPIGETSAPPSTPSDHGSTSSPSVPAESIPLSTAIANPQGPAGSVTAAVPARQAAAPGVLNWPPVGASYVQSVRKSGSFGSGVETRTVTYLGEQTWQGHKVRAFTEGSITTYVDSRRRILARVASSTGAPIESFEPYFILADWPLRIGKWWPNRYRYSDHEWGRSFNDVRYDGEVEAYEDVRTLAGTFRGFRIALGGTASKTVHWYSGDLGLVIKTRAERLSNHHRGPGVYESELISYDFKP